MESLPIEIILHICSYLNFHEYISYCLALNFPLDYITVLKLLKKDSSPMILVQNIILRGNVVNSILTLIFRECFNESLITLNYRILKIIEGNIEISGGNYGDVITSNGHIICYDGKKVGCIPIEYVKMLIDNIKEHNYFGIICGTFYKLNRIEYDKLLNI